MNFTDAELRFLNRQPLGHLSTVGPDGTPQVKPLAFTYNADLGTIDISGFDMTLSAKYRNIQANPRVSFVVDEATGQGFDGVHFLEVRGSAETAIVPGLADVHLSIEIIRIRPRRIIAFNVGPDQTGMHARDVAPAGSGQPVS